MRMPSRATPPPPLPPRRLGHSQVLMIVTCSPTPAAAAETLSSLAFAARARGVELRGGGGSSKGRK